MTTNDNMRIWNQVCTTDPHHTKKVTQRGGFTSINAEYTIQRATEVFGPVGLGWGYDVTYEIQNGLIMAFVTIWHGDRANKFGPVIGCNVLQAQGGTDDRGNPTPGRIDDDAGKKALTDALTKGLSHLGFSADVFLGYYDDQKYVADLNRQAPAAAPARTAAPQAQAPAAPQPVPQAPSQLLPELLQIIRDQQIPETTQKTMLAYFKAATFEGLTEHQIQIAIARFRQQQAA